MRRYRLLATILGRRLPDGTLVPEDHITVPVRAKFWTRRGATKYAAAMRLAAWRYDHAIWEYEIIHD